MGSDRWAGIPRAFSDMANNGGGKSTMASKVVTVDDNSTANVDAYFCVNVLLLRLFYGIWLRS